MLWFTEADEVTIAAEGRPPPRVYVAVAALFLLVGVFVLVAETRSPERFGLAGIFVLGAAMMILVQRRTVFRVAFHRPSRSYQVSKIAGADPERRWDGTFEDIQAFEWRDTVLVLRGADTFEITDEEGAVGARLVEWLTSTD